MAHGGRWSREALQEGGKWFGKGCEIVEKRGTERGEGG